VPEVFSGKVEFKNTQGNVILTVDPDSGFVQITMKTPGGHQVMQLTNTGSLSLWGAGDDHGARLDGILGDLFLGGAGRVGTARLRDANKNDIIVLDATNAAIYVGASGNEGDIIVRDGSGRDVFQVDGNNAAVYVGANGNEGDVIVRDGSGRDVFHVDGNNAAVYVGADGNEGDVIVRNGSGAETIRLDGASGDIVLSNADCAEDFEVASPEEAGPGTVMVLSEGGGVAPSHAPYDRRVAGVVSGAGGLRPGIVLGRRKGARSRCPLALAGTVFCQADASNGPIGLGDLLTTSSTPGHAMRATDPMRAFGAVLGKALGELGAGRGLVPVLVALQ
jgi:hypothetical protein